MDVRRFKIISRLNINKQMYKKNESRMEKNAHKSSRIV